MIMLTQTVILRCYNKVMLEHVKRSPLEFYLRLGILRAGDVFLSKWHNISVRKFFIMLNFTLYVFYCVVVV